ncbi:Splicing factor 45 [Coemansia sp. RSA 552]|nr:Splicing factor 45 [Coemansia sp. RSA 552]
MTPENEAVDDGVPNPRQPGPSAKPRVGNVVKPVVPLLNPKHPHSMPQGDPAALMSRWEAAAAAAAAAGKEVVATKATLATKGPSAKPINAATAAVAAAAASTPPLAISLAEYLPSNGRNKRRVEFDPYEAYNPALPNDYQTCKRWIERQQLDRPSSKVSGGDAAEDSEDDGSEREEAGEPGQIVVLTNMADAIDADLERETMEECQAFGDVVSCTAELAEHPDNPFRRVRIVVEFAEQGAAVQARETLDRRFFDGRHISATFHHPAPAADPPG